MNYHSLSPRLSWSTCASTLAPTGYAISYWRCSWIGSFDLLGSHFSSKEYQPTDDVALQFCLSLSNLDFASMIIISSSSLSFSFIDCIPSAWNWTSLFIGLIAHPFTQLKLNNCFIILGKAYFQMNETQSLTIVQTVMLTLLAAAKDSCCWRIVAAFHMGIALGHRYLLAQRLSL